MTRPTWCFLTLLLILPINLICQSAAAEQIVDQLRAEGLIRSGSAATDQEIEDIIE